MPTDDLATCQLWTQTGNPHRAAWAWLPLPWQRARIDRIPDDITGGTEPGWPRPVVDGRMVPWITQRTVDGVPLWRRFKTERLLYCQTAFSCQLCGGCLERKAWAIINDHREIVTNAALHQQCAAAAKAGCPALPSDQSMAVVELGFQQIHANGISLAEITDYGDEVLNWTVPTFTPVGNVLPG